MDALEERISRIEERNVAVTADKAWETSWIRRVAIAGLTYLVVVLFLSEAATASPWVAALVPVIGFLLSTLTLGFLKKNWIKNH